MFALFHIEPDGDDVMCFTVKGGGNSLREGRSGVGDVAIAPVALLNAW